MRGPALISMWLKTTLYILGHHASHCTGVEDTVLDRRTLRKGRNIVARANKPAESMRMAKLIRTPTTCVGPHLENHRCGGAWVAAGGGVATTARCLALIGCVSVPEAGFVYWRGCVYDGSTACPATSPPGLPARPGALAAVPDAWAIGRGRLGMLWTSPWSGIACAATNQLHIGVHVSVHFGIRIHVYGDHRGCIISVTSPEGHASCSNCRWHLS